MTTQKHTPHLPLPGPLMGSEIGSFAWHTVTVRLPEIARRSLEENMFSPGQVARINQLIEEMPEAKIRRLTDSAAPDFNDWNRAIAPYQDNNWLDVPWFFAETYFYRRMLEVTGYFSAGEGRGVDPYQVQKVKGLEASSQDIARISAQVNSLLDSGVSPVDGLKRMLLFNLWANQVDLSLWPAGQADRPDHADAQNAAHYILIDDRDAAARWIARLKDSGRPCQVVDFLIDNAGFELVCDLSLADYLLASRLVDAVRFNLKIHPTFVSDALVKDVLQTVEFLSQQAEADSQAMGRRLGGYIADGRLLLIDHKFWTSPHAIWELPQDLRDLLGQSGLVISKGDANYRRLLGDRHWAVTDAFAAIVIGLPAALVALRTLKSDPLVGLKAGQAQAVGLLDEKWRTDGRWGIIQAALK